MLPCLGQVLPPSPLTLVHNSSFHISSFCSLSRITSQQQRGEGGGVGGGVCLLKYIITLSQRCYYYLFCAQPSPLAGPSWTQLPLAFLDIREVYSSFSEKPALYPPPTHHYPDIAVKTQYNFFPGVILAF